MTRKLIYILSLIFVFCACGPIKKEQHSNPVVETKKEFKIYTEFPADVEYLSDIEYGRAGEQVLRLNILRSKEKASRPQPVIVWIHGGGWNSGSKNDFIESFSGFAQQEYLFVSIDYRLSAQAHFPAQLEDCKCAIRFLRAKAREYNINPGRIGAWGASAGGHLAGLLGTTGEVKGLEGAGGWNEQSSSVQAVCDWYGPTDFTAPTNDLKYPVELVAQLLGGTPASWQDKAAKASVTTYISQGDPPFFIMHGDKDEVVPLSQSQTLHDRLKKSGVDSSLMIVKGAGHGFGSIEEFKAVKEFFDRHLKPG